MINNIITCIPIARQLLGKRISAARMHVTIGSPLLDNGPLNTFSLKHLTTIWCSLLSNGSVNSLNQQ
jgi:hypothetical protein